MESTVDEPNEETPIDENAKSSTSPRESATPKKSARETIEDPSSMSVALPGVASRFSSIGGSDSAFKSESRGTLGARRESRDAATKREVAQLVGPRRPSVSHRGSLVPVVDTHGIFTRRGRRGSAFRQQDTPKEIPDKTFSTLFEPLSQQCRNFDKPRIPVNRIQLVGRIVDHTFSSDHMKSFITAVSDQSGPGSVTGFGLLYPSHVVLIVEVTEVVFLACLKALKSQYELGNIQIVFEDYDVPLRMLDEFLCLTVDTPFDHFDDQNEQINDLREVARAFIERTILICLKLSALHKSPDDMLKEQGMMQVQKLFTHPDHLNTIVDSDAFHSPQSYISLCQSTLQIDGLGDDCEWAYPTAPTNINS